MWWRGLLGFGRVCATVAVRFSQLACQPRFTVRITGVATNAAGQLTTGSHDARQSHHASRTPRRRWPVSPPAMVSPALQQLLEGPTTRRLRFSSQCGAGYSAVAPRGGDYLLHHRWVAFLFRRLTARAGGQESGQWTATPGLPTRPSTENLRFLVFRAGKGPTPRQSAGPATGGLPATSRRNPREGGKQGTPESGREAEEVIAVEVERTGGMMPSPRNPDRRPLQRNA